MWNTVVSPLSVDQQVQVCDEAAKLLADGLKLAEIVDVDILAPRAAVAINTVLTRLRLPAPQEQVSTLAESVMGRVGGLGFFLPLFRREDLCEIAVNPDATLWVLRKTQRDFELQQKDLDPQEVWRGVEALLRPTGRSVNEAVPTVSAKLPRVRSLPGLKGGARLQINHPAIATGEAELPSLNIRLFEPEPVKPETLIRWGMAPENVIRKLIEFVTREARVLTFGGTVSGKTTFTSALCSGIPKTARIVKVEDPEEIWIDHPHVVTLEVRDAVPGTSVEAFSLRNGVDRAMRMSPRWLIVGEVRTGDAAAALFRAQMSDHPGLSTFHAESPGALVERLALIMYIDEKVSIQGAKGLIAQAIDIVCQVGWVEPNKRGLVGVWQVGKSLKDGEVVFTPLYRHGDHDIQEFTGRP
jgi:pilus assembly protein CpaF